MSAPADLLTRAREASRLAMAEKGHIAGIDPADLGLGAAWLVARDCPAADPADIARRIENNVERAGWGTLGLDLAIQIPGDAIEPVAFLSTIEAAALRLARDPRALGRAYRTADLEPRHGRAQALAHRQNVSVRRAQQALKLQRDDLERGQGDLFDGEAEPC